MDEDARLSRRRRLRRFAVFVGSPVLGLAAVLLAIARGAAAGRWWPVAGFLMLWALAGAYTWTAGIALGRRMTRLRRAPVPRGVPLATPFWIKLDRMLTMLGLAAVLGTVVAALGFPGIAVGVLLVLGGFLVVAGMGVASLMSGVRALTFEDGGVRFHARAWVCFVPWAAIGEIQRIGPDHFEIVRVAIADLDGAGVAVSPDTPRSREAARSTFSQGNIVLDPWTAGLDGRTLARAIAEGKAGVSGEVN